MFNKDLKRLINQNLNPNQNQKQKVKPTPNPKPNRNLNRNKGTIIFQKKNKDNINKENIADKIINTKKSHIKFKE